MVASYWMHVWHWLYVAQWRVCRLVGSSCILICPLCAPVIQCVHECAACLFWDCFVYSAYEFHLWGSIKASLIWNGPSILMATFCTWHHAKKGCPRCPKSQHSRQLILMITLFVSHEHHFIMLRNPKPDRLVMPVFYSSNTMIRQLPFRGAV